MRKRQRKGEEAGINQVRERQEGHIRIIAVLGNAVMGKYIAFIADGQKPGVCFALLEYTEMTSAAKRFSACADERCVIIEPPQLGDLFLKSSAVT